MKIAPNTTVPPLFCQDIILGIVPPSSYDVSTDEICQKNDVSKNSDSCIVEGIILFQFSYLLHYLILMVHHRNEQK